ncbi:MAG: DUF3570 domain-containing protein [Myxococcales bacterium]|jgi:hypothetical protein
MGSTRAICVGLALVSACARGSQVPGPGSLLELRPERHAAHIAQQRQLRREGAAGGHGTADGFDRLTTLAGPQRAPRSGGRLTGQHVASDRDADYAQVSARGAVTGAVDLSARYGLQRLDALSSASVAQTGAGDTSVADERRDEVELGARHDDGKLEVGLAAGLRDGPEDSRLAASVGGSLLAHEALRLGLGLGYAATDVGPVGDPEFDESKSELMASARIRFDVDVSQALSLGYGLSYLRGFLASPYTVVAVGPLPLAESPPRDRLRHALTLRWAHRVGAGGVLGAHLRGYLDDWGVRAGTLGARYTHALGAFRLGGFARGYAQGAADFARPFYPAGYAGPTTADWRLFDVETLELGLQAGHIWTLEGGQRLSLRLTLDHRRLLEPSPTINESQLGVGLGVAVAL